MGLCWVGLFGCFLGVGRGGGFAWVGWLSSDVWCSGDVWWLYDDVWGFGGVVCL